MNNNPIVLALEIGTSKMVAVAGELLNSSEINVLSVGRGKPGGVKKADIIDLGKAASLAQSAIEEAQKEIGNADVDFVYLAISGSQISAINIKARHRAREKRRQKQNSATRRLLHKPNLLRILHRRSIR